MKKPMVSIIIPVYNGSNFLREAINSALNQTYENIEVIVVNDGSDDGGLTEDIILSYGDKIKYINKENGGVATALNVGIRQMKGEYFSWLSHDDLYDSEKIQQQIEAIDKNGLKEAIVYSDYTVLEQDTGSNTLEKLQDTYTIQQLTHSIFPVLRGILHGCTLLIHKSHFERVGVFDDALITTQDYDLWFRMFRKQKLIYLNQNTVFCRVHNEQGSRTIECHTMERDELYLKMLQEISEEEIQEMYGSAYNFYHNISCYCKGGNMQKAYEYAHQKFKSCQVPAEMVEALNRLQNDINDLSGRHAKKICIFGVGQWGQRLYSELKSKLIKVDYFADNDSTKWGYMLDGICCLSIDELLKQKEEVLVIVAVRASDSIVLQLQDKQFPYVVTKQNIDKLMFKVPPVKWITNLENLQGLDYSRPEIRGLVDRFNEVIYDICKYYQDRTSKRES